MVGWSWSAFVVYMIGLVFMTLGGFVCLIEYGHPAFLAPILMGLFFLYITWQIFVEDNPVPPPGSRQR